jgi:hypothetical protein
MFAINETQMYSYDVSADCAASPSCAAQTNFLWTTGGKERVGRFMNDNVVIRYYLDGALDPQLEFFQVSLPISFFNQLRSFHAPFTIV